MHLRSIECPQHSSNSCFHACCLHDRKPSLFSCFQKQTLLTVCDREGKFFVDLKQLQNYLSHPCLHCRTPHGLLSTYSFRSLYLLLVLLFLFPSLPFPRVCIIFLLGTKQNPSHCLIQGILLSLPLWF